MPPLLPAAVTLLALLLYFVVTARCGSMRVRHRIEAPAVAGHPEYERALRVQQNTVEQLVFFLPALWLCALFLSPSGAAALGLVWVIGRALYAWTYWRDAARRTSGFLISLLAAVLLYAGAVAGMVMTYY